MTVICHLTWRYTEDDWDCPEQTKLYKGVKLDFPFTMKTCQGKSGRNKKKYTPYDEGFVVDRIVLSDVADSIVGLHEKVVSHEIDLINDTYQDWIDDRSKPEVEFKAEVEQMNGKELTNLRVLEWLHDLPVDPK